MGPGDSSTSQLIITILHIDSLQIDYCLSLQCLQVLTYFFQFRNKNVGSHFQRYDEAASLNTEDAPAPSFAAVRREKCKISVTR